MIFFNFLQNVSGSGKEMGQAYINFARNSMDQIRSKVNDELWILNFFEVSINLRKALFIIYCVSFGDISAAAEHI